MIGVCKHCSETRELKINGMYCDIGCRDSMPRTRLNRGVSLKCGELDSPKQKSARDSSRALYFLCFLFDYFAICNVLPQSLLISEY
jgi:hypothetical protein